MERIEFLKSVIAHCTDEEAVAYAKNRLTAAEEYARRNSGEAEKEREGLFMAILDCVADVAKPASIIATELNISSQKAQSYCRSLEKRRFVEVTTGVSPVNPKRNVKYFKKGVNEWR